MPIPSFEQFHKATNLGLSRFADWLPILLRAGLLLLFACYGIALFCSAITAKRFLAILVVLFLLSFFLIMGFTYCKYWNNDPPVPSSTTPLWPFLLINLAMILLVAAIGDGNPGLLKFTHDWVQTIGGLLTGGGK